MSVLRCHPVGLAVPYGGISFAVRRRGCRSVLLGADMPEHPANALTTTIVPSRAARLRKTLCSSLETGRINKVCLGVADRATVVPLPTHMDAGNCVTVHRRNRAWLGDSCDRPGHRRSSRPIPKLRTGVRFSSPALFFLVRKPSAIGQCLTCQRWRIHGAVSCDLPSSLRTILVERDDTSIPPFATWSRWLGKFDRSAGASPFVPIAPRHVQQVRPSQLSGLLPLTGLLFSMAVPRETLKTPPPEPRPPVAVLPLTGLFSSVSLPPLL